jgi:hypothetical protein
VAAATFIDLTADDEDLSGVEAGVRSCRRSLDTALACASLGQCEDYDTDSSDEAEAETRGGDLEVDYMLYPRFSPHDYVQVSLVSAAESWDFRVCVCNVSMVSASISWDIVCLCVFLCLVVVFFYVVLVTMEDMGVLRCDITSSEC